MPSDVPLRVLLCDAESPAVGGPEVGGQLGATA